VKNKGSFDLQPYQHFFPLFFTGRKLRPPGIGIEFTGQHNSNYPLMNNYATTTAGKT